MKDIEHSWDKKDFFFNPLNYDPLIKAYLVILFKMK